MKRRNFLLFFFLWILSFFFGYTAKKEGDKLVLDRINSKMVSGNEGRSIADEIGVITDFKAKGSSITEKTINEFTERGINVKWYGAKGDGITDDTQAIQKLFNTLPKNSVLFFPSGTYKISSKLKWDGTISLVGQNRENTILKAFVPFSTLLYKNDEHIECGCIENLTFDGNGKVDYVFDFPKGKGLRISSNYFKNARERVVRIGNSHEWGAYELYFYNNNVIGIESSIGYLGRMPEYALEISENCSDSSFFNNIITNSRRAGILSTGGHNHINDNHIYGYPNDYKMRYSIEITSPTSNYYRNRCDTPLEAGIYVKGWGNSIDSNLIFWNDTVTNLDGTTGIKIDNTRDKIKNLSVTNNTINGVVAIPPVDITLKGTMPRHSNVNGNMGNMANSFEILNFKGQLRVVADSSSVDFNFTNAFKYYEYVTIMTPGWDAGGFWVTRKLTGFTVHWSKNPTFNTEVYYEVKSI
ncbi:glycosyl hydrolase family 28-related protein [Peribacillus simplex]|uniref:glycosyl hydrolase family 28-related protein n=1 Tax=Peribacillus simplex TaxID=1478 RepID=UPI003CEA6B90